MKIFHHQTCTRNSKTPILLMLFSLLLSTSSASYSAIISDLYITEIMANPSAVSDSNGEWFELYNPGNDIFDLNGSSLSDNGSNYHLINSSLPLLINPGEYFVFGKNGNTLENGGYNADYVYSNFTLANTADEIILTDPLGNILALEYQAGFVPNGHSLELIAPDMQTANYINTVNNSYGLGDFGTPGSEGTHSFQVAAVPEPPILLLFLSGIAGLIYRQTRE